MIICCTIATFSHVLVIPCNQLIFAACAHTLPVCTDIREGIPKAAMSLLHLNGHYVTICSNLDALITSLLALCERTVT